MSARDDRYASGSDLDASKKEKLVEIIERRCQRDLSVTLFRALASLTRDNLRELADAIGHQSERDP